MKKYLTTTLLFFIFLQIGTVRAADVAARGGDGVGNGGDGYATEFVLTAKTAVELLKKVSPEKVEGVNLATLSGTILNTEVHTKDQLVLNGQEVDAINYPNKKLIELSRSRWEQLRGEDQTIARYNLVLHEYLFVMHLDDSQYRISQKLIQTMSPSKFSTDMWWNPLNPVNSVWFHTIDSGWGCSGGNMNFDLNMTEESKISNLDCMSKHRFMTVTKTSSMGANNDIKGTVHKFHVEVFDENNKKLGSLDYEPIWGNCIIFSGDSCAQSGKIGVGDLRVEFIQHK